MRTTIISRTSSNLGQIGPRTVELSALARLKNGCIVNSCFSHIHNRVTALDSCQNLVFTQYRENELTKGDKILYTHYY